MFAVSQRLIRTPSTWDHQWRRQSHEGVTNKLVALAVVANVAVVAAVADVALVAHLTTDASDMWAVSVITE